MKLILCILLLPCLCAAKEQNILCPDGKECPMGTYCCAMTEGAAFKCCDIPGTERLNRKLIPAFQSKVTSNVSNTSPNGAHAARDFCITQCGMYCCAHDIGTCCDNPRYCCEFGTRCCSNSYDERPWCCRTRDRCHSVSGYCISGAATVSATILSLISAFVFAGMSKHFL